VSHLICARRVAAAVVLWSGLALLAAPPWARAADAAAAPAAPVVVPEVVPVVVPDTLAQRLLPCTTCHGAQGRAAREGYLPRIAGKPEGYLYQQLLNFRDGRRRHATMSAYLAHQSDAYLHEMARHFANLDLPHAAPPATTAPAAQLARGEQLARRGDPSRRLPACTACHAETLGGTLPQVPGLLGLPRDYLIAQLGAWQTGSRRAVAPDCMADIAKRLQPDEASAVASWLAAQPVPPGLKASPAPTAASATSPPLPCGSVRAPLP